MSQDEHKRMESELSALRSAKSSQDLRWAEEQARLQGPLAACSTTFNNTAITFSKYLTRRAELVPAASLGEYEQALTAARQDLAVNNAQYNQDVTAMQQQITDIRELNGSLELTVRARAAN